MKMVNNLIKKTKEKLRKRALEKYQSHSEKEKEKNVEYMRNYYLAHNK